MTPAVVLIGVPWDEQSSFLRGAAAAPDAVRRALASPSGNMTAENGVEIVLGGNMIDAGNLALPGGEPAAVAAAITDGISRLGAPDRALLALGGDHAVTFPIVRAVAARVPGLNILHIDAHPDLYDTFEGQPYSHACPFARIMEAGLAARLVQVGIRAMTGEQRAQVDRFGVEQIQMQDWTGREDISFDGPVYLSLDLDALDPAFVPGVSHYEPGGLSVTDVVRLIRRFRGELIAADIVELNPSRDRHDMTAMVAAKFVKEIASRMLDAAR
jgi:arginase